MASCTIFLLATSRCGAKIFGSSVNLKCKLVGRKAVLFGFHAQPYRRGRSPFLNSPQSHTLGSFCTSRFPNPRWRPGFQRVLTPAPCSLLPALRLRVSNGTTAGPPTPHFGLVQSGLREPRDVGARNQTHRRSADKLLSCPATFACVHRACWQASVHHVIMNDGGNSYQNNFRWSKQRQLDSCRQRIKLAAQGGVSYHFRPRPTISSEPLIRRGTFRIFQPSAQ